MSLELLANELFFEIFDYLYAVELLRSFDGLNNRLNSLVKKYFLKHRFDFRRSSKNDFDLICQRHLPFLTNEILSLGLSDDDEIPTEITQFRSFGYRLIQFSNLRSLTFDQIRQGEIITDILPECQQIIHLNLTSCYFQCPINEIHRLINNIWNLPSLIYCYLNLIFKSETHVPVPTTISRSIEHLTIIGVWIHLNELTHLSQCTPRLRYFAFDYSQTNDLGLQMIIPSLNELNLTYVGVELDPLENLLQHLPNLRRLKIESCYLEMNGYQWENLIRTFLHRLEQFQLKIKLTIHGEKRKTDFIKSFQTRFWIEERRWFIQYHYSFDQSSQIISLYTLPYVFYKLDLTFPLQIFSTLSHEQFDYSFENVTHFLYRSTSNQEQTNLFCFQFANLTHLSVTLPINQQFLVFVNKLDRLISLEVSKSKLLSNDDAQIQLQSIIDHAPILYSLKFQSWPIADPLSLTGQFSPFSIQSSSIQRYNFRGYDHSFTDEQLISIDQSTFSMSCQTLIIRVKNRMNVIYLFNSLPNLRSLIVRSDDDNGRGYPSNQDPFVQWFIQNFSPTSSIQRDLRYPQYIRIWIGH